MLLTHSGTLLQIAYNGFSSVASTAYTSCAYFRRVDGVIPTVGDITVTSRGGTAVALTIEPTGSDSWVRGCATFTSGVGADARAPFYNFVADTVDYYVDAVQLETGSTVRSYADFRASYTVSRNADGGVANAWSAGDAMFDTGATAGYGWLDCYSIFGLRAVTEIGPACVANVRTGTGFNAWEPYAGWGQLNGLWEYSSSTFGFVAGPKSGAHVAVDNVNGIRFWNGTTLKADFDLAETSRWAITSRPRRCCC
jgi:hypothetical protein